MKAAFTLLELLIVIALVGVIAGVGFLSLGGWNCRQDNLNNFERFSQFMRETQSEALNRSAATLVQVSTAGTQDFLRAHLLPDDNCTISANSSPLDFIIPVLTFQEEITIVGPVAQCFYSNGSADDNSYQFGRSCGDNPNLFRLQFFAATGLVEKLKFSNIRNLWEDL
jgi:prepilin-type N-terminal cleavage/methylation domain-containing protein